nr:cingulin-like [Aegilops tauschii subsp. strangulata]
MPDFNAHDLDPSWAEPEVEWVQEFFDNLSERYIRDEPLLIRDTTKAELAYITARAEEAALAQDAGSCGTMEDEADAAAEEKEFAEWAVPAREASGAGAGAPRVEDVVEESIGEELEAEDSSPPARRRILRRASSGELVRPSRTVQREMETLAQRVAKRSKASAGVKSPASTSRTPVVVEISPDASPRRSPRFSPQHPPSMDQEDIDILIGEVAKDAEAEAVRIAAEEAAKSATGEAGEGLARESGKATVEEVGEDLFVRLPGTADTRAPAEGEVFDDEVPATAGLQVVEEPSAGGDGSQEEQLLRAMGGNFQKLQMLHRARQDKVRSRMAAVDKAEADLDERIAQAQVWFGEARDELKPAQGELDERKRELILKQADIEKAREVTKEQAEKDEALAATLRGKDEEIGKIFVQRTQELEQRHKEALDAQALVHADKVKELELEREELKKKVSALTEERDTANHTLADVQVAISDKAKLLSEANDLKLKLEGLEGKLSEAGAREETLNKALEDEKRLRRDEAAEHKEYAKSVNL